MTCNLVLGKLPKTEEIGHSGLPIDRRKRLSHNALASHPLGPRYRLALGSMLRHRYQLATVQYGRHAWAMASISAGVGRASRP